MTKTILTLGSSLLLSSLLVACSGEQKTTDASSKDNSPKEKPQFTRKQYTEPHLGTSVQVVFYTTKPGEADALAKKCFDKVKELNAVFSDYDSKSEVSILCQKALRTPHKVSQDLFSVIETAQQVSKATEGAFDITLGQLTKHWGAQARLHKVAQKTVDPDRKTTEEIPKVSYTDLILDPNKQTVAMSKRISIDLGGIAKGYIADQLIALLKEEDINHAGVLIGGEIVVGDAPPGKEGWSIGLENPEYKTVGKLSLSNASMSTSGDSYQFYETKGVRHAHIIDPKKRQSKNDRLNVTVIASSGTLADAWATALRVSKKSDALEMANKYKVKAAFLSLEEPILRSHTFPELKKK